MDRFPSSQPRDRMPMTPQPDAIAFLLDKDDLQHILRDWPAALRLAVCVDREGGCVMLVHHRDEDDRILDRISEAIQQPVGAFCVVPERPGCPTRKMLFSEEQRLLSLVAETEGLAETAADYAINYAFAAEEGLDAQMMTAGVPGPGAGPQPVAAGPAEDLAGEPTEGPGGARRMRAGLRRFGWRPVARTEAAEDPAGGEAMEDPSGAPEGFRRLNRDERRHGLFVGGRLSVARGGRVAVAIGQAADEGPAAEVDAVFFRDDLLCFVIPVSALAGLDRLPERLSLDAAQFPAAMLALLEEAPQAVRITASGRYLYVSLPPAQAQGLAPGLAPPPTLSLRAEPREAVAPRRRRPRGLRAGLGGAAALMLLAVLHTGLSGAIGRLDAQTPAQTADGALRAQIFAPAGPRP